VNGFFGERGGFSISALLLSSLLLSSSSVICSRESSGGASSAITPIPRIAAGNDTGVIENMPNGSSGALGSCSI